PAVGLTFEEDQLAKIAINSYENSGFLFSPLQQDAVPRICAPLPRFYNVMTLISEPDRYASASATINEESHQAGTCNESSLSCEIAACAYTRHARRSSDSRSG